MTQQVANDFPPIEAAYTDEFGVIDPQVYKVAQEIWSPAKRFAARYSYDSDKIKELMLKAAAKVSQIHTNQPSEIKNLRSYLYKVYKRLILAGLEKENNRREKFDKWFREQESETEKGEENEINKKILINELRLKMDDWMREVFDLLRLGYSYEELVPRYGSGANVIRSRFSKKLAQLTRMIQTEMKSTDKEIDRLQ